MSSYGCWLCPARFQNNRDLKNHAVSEPHSAMKVVCPWCPREKTYRRVSELKDHSRRNHLLMMNKEDQQFFTEANGAWLALRPADYVKLVKQTAYHSSLATRTRDLVITLSRRCNLRKSRRDWEEGWSAMREDLPSAPKRPRMEEYDPARPEMTDRSGLTIHSIKLESTGTVAEVFKEDKDRECHWYLVEFLPTLKHDARAVQALVRRMTTLKPDHLRSSPFGEGVNGELDDPAMKCELSKLLGIETKLFKDIWKRVVASPFAQKPNETDEDKNTDGNPENHPILSLDEDFTITPTSSSASSPYQSPMETQAQRTPPRKVELSEYLKRPVIHRMTETGDHQQATPATPVQQATPTPLARLATTTGLPATPAATLPQPATTPVLPVTPSATYTPTPLPVPVRKPQEGDAVTARNILRTGCMPLVPPGWRRWGKEETVTLRAGPTTIKWPPKGWKSLTPDQMLMAWEFAALQLEVGGSSIPTYLKRGDLLDKYNMLGLDGTTVALSNDGNPSERMARYHLYETLRNATNNNTKNLPMIKMIEHTLAHRDTSTDWIVNIIEDANIKLHLEDSHRK